MIDQLLCNEIQKNSKSDSVAVLMSGGVDSISCAFAAHRLGKKIHAYTFHLENDPSYDAMKAIEVAKIMNWGYTLIEVPTKNLENDFIYLATDIECKKKTHFECTFPFLYVYPRIKESEIISGWAADGHYGISKKACMHYKEPKSKFDEFRVDYFKSNPAGFDHQINLANKYGKKFIAPYLESVVINFFRQYDWHELNEPFQKHHVVNSFPEFKTIGKFKKHINLQLGSNTNKLFESLLVNNKINFKKRVRIMDICRDWHKLSKSSHKVENHTTLERFVS